jgi:spore coat polysaccharide biosynthesis protein SpsF
LREKRRITGIIQARTGSTRLPGKVLADICGEAMLTHIIKRARHSRLCKSFILATTIDPVDDILLSIAEKNNVPLFRGHKEDVLDRFYHAAKAGRAEIIVRITADDPFKDPEILDSIVETYLEGDYDYVSNTLEPSYPEGLDIEVFSFEALEYAFHNARKSFQRLHVTPFIYMNPHIFKTHNVMHTDDLSPLRLTVDTLEDLVFARAIYEKLYTPHSLFLLADILFLLDSHPEIKGLMPDIPRNLGFMESMRESYETDR